MTRFHVSNALQGVVRPLNRTGEGFHLGRIPRLFHHHDAEMIPS